MMKVIFGNALFRYRAETVVLCDVVNNLKRQFTFASILQGSNFIIEYFLKMSIVDT